MGDNYEKQVLAAQCQACGARSGERCESNTGYERITPHLDRVLAAESLALRLPERKRRQYIRRSRLDPKPHDQDGKQNYQRNQ